MSTAPRDATTDVDMGYKDPAPWTFTGKALYQLALVRAEDARAHVPSDLRLVEFAGHTLGGLYVARYDESPCGKLDEVVVLGGLVWNPPTSCAWASRVYVDSAEARDGNPHVRIPCARGGVQGRDGRVVKAKGLDEQN